jgi:nucleotide-binding universal stress UspA family protein
VRRILSILNILVPVVFSERCAWAARYAARLAREFGSQLLFLHVGQLDDADRLEGFVSKEIRATPYKSQINRSRR